jgi:trk system potassium uptake protein TrkA
VRIILIGGGEVVFFLARVYLGKGYKVSIINRNRDMCEQLAQSLDRALVIYGDGTDPKILEDAQARESQLLIAATPKDYVNLVCCQTGSLLFEVPKTLAVINDPDNLEVFKDLGITRIFNQTDLIVSMLERNVDYDYLNQLASWGDNQVFIHEVIVNEKMPSIGRTISELNLPDKSEIIGFERDDKFVFANNELIIQPEDRIVILTTPDSYAPTLRLIVGEEI